MSIVSIETNWSRMKGTKAAVSSAVRFDLRISVAASSALSTNAASGSSIARSASTNSFQALWRGGSFATSLTPKLRLRA